MIDTLLNTAEFSVAVLPDAASSPMLTEAFILMVVLPIFFQ